MAGNTNPNQTSSPENLVGDFSALTTRAVAVIESEIQADISIGDVVTLAEQKRVLYISDDPTPVLAQSDDFVFEVGVGLSLLNTSAILLLAAGVVALSYNGGSNAVVLGNAGGQTRVIGDAVFIRDTSTMLVDGNAVAGNTRFMIYDVDTGVMQRVSVGIANSGGAGFKLLRIPN